LPITRFSLTLLFKRPIFTSTLVKIPAKWVNWKSPYLHLLNKAILLHHFDMQTYRGEMSERVFACSLLSVEYTARSLDLVRKC